MVSDERDDPRADALVRRLAAPTLGTAAARERVWSRIAERRRPGRRPGRLPAFAAVAIALLILVGGAWLESYRIEVGHPGTRSGDFGPLLYREEVARISFGGEANGALVVRQRHIDEPRRGRLSVVVEADVEFASASGAIELRYRDTRNTATQVLIRKTTEGSDTKLEAVAPLPEHDLGDIRTYEVWLHIESSGGAPIDAGMVSIEITERPEGQRARLLAVP